MSEYFDPATVTLSDVIRRTMGSSKDTFYGDNFKLEDHPGRTGRFDGAAGYVQINISAPDTPKGHISFDIPYDSNGIFGKAVRHD